MYQFLTSHRRLAAIAVLSILLKSINLPIITTQFSTFLLWITGSDAVREGVMIILPTGRVEVYGACSGIESIIQMFSIAVLFCLIIPLQKIAQIICLIIAIGLGFIVNAARVALMAVLVASSQLEAFEYWHGGDGSLIFSAISLNLAKLFILFSTSFKRRKTSAHLAENQVNLMKLEQ